MPITISILLNITILINLDIRHSLSGMMTAFSPEPVFPCTPTGIWKSSLISARVAITHEDSLGNKGVTKAGEIQIMSAGTGITHSEYNHEDVETLLFQIWIHPNENNIQPRWENVAINSFHEPGIHILASGENELVNSNIIKLFQDATLYLINGEQEKDLDFELKNGRQMYLVAAKGAVMINKNRVNSRDGVFIINEDNLYFNFQEDSELIFFDLPAINT